MIICHARKVVSEAFHTLRLMILKKFLLYSSSNKKRSAVIGQIFNSMNVNEDLAGKKQIASKTPIILHTDR
ncbi:hypothetical protein T05_5559 [Trichinella murrelli]|uniref:Uncharacterized protein n=1 Tax=Trichinella murrelli TaxID=144512 RepID=A0A0V0UFR4_9BILA|nr:hypothetical protein T05_5559 [Trichinella murrelli]